MTRGEILAVSRLDAGDVLRSRWLLFCLVVYALLGGILVLVGLRESSVLGFTGMGRVLFSLCHVLVLLLPLLALLATGHVVNRARDDGTLELLLTHPIGRDSYLVAVTLVRGVVLVLPLFVLMGALGLTGQILFGQPVPWGFVARTLAVSASLSLAFVGLGIAVSVHVRSASRATTVLLAIWAAGIALVDFALIGLLLQWHAPPRVVFLLAALNPVEAARMALLGAAEPDLAALGPVGFYLSTQVGARALFALGVAWPATVGALAWAFALRGFRRGDAL